MKILFACSVCICLMLSTFGQRQQGGWKGIVPLHSTRTDVERLLGPSEDKCKCFYETEKEKIFVHYSDGPCEGFLHGWDVAKDTVLMVTVRPNVATLLSDLSLDFTRLAKSSGTDTPELYYTDRAAGVRYQVSELGVVESVSFIPKRSDYARRCKGFPSIPDLGHREFNPFDTFSNIPFADEQARLDNFSISLQEQPQLKGYILIYASKDFPASRAKMRAKRARDYLVKVRGVDPKMIGIVDGGYREQFQIELYILRADVGPPTPYPTVAPPSVTNGGFKTNMRRGRRSLK